MHKAGLILILILLIGTGCSSVKRSARVTTEQPESALISDLSGAVRELNITNSDFYIQKAEIEINNNGEREKLLGSVKYRNPGEYLVSIRTRTGMEAARFYLNRDTILVNDRINRKLYYGSSEYLEKKYGIAMAFLPVLFGDFKAEDDRTTQNPECINGKAEIKRIVSSNIMYFMIDCNLLKIKGIKIENNGNEEGIILTFDNFFKEGRIRYPKNLKIEDNNSESTIRIFIDKMLIPWEGAIDFVVGKNYEMVQLQ